jgi:hypothetical protein
MKLFKKIFFILFLLLILLVISTNFNSKTVIISSKSFLEDNYDYFKLSDFRIKGDTVKAGENIGYSCYITLNQILGGYVLFKTDSGDAFKANFVAPSAERNIAIPYDVKPGKYHIVEILAGGTGREGGMISKTFTDPEIFKDQYLTVINDNYKETQPTTKETNSSSTTKNTTSNISEITSKEIENTTKKTTDSSTSSISFEFIFVIVGFLVVAGLLFFLKALTDE